MNRRNTPTMKWEEAQALLGVPAEASEAEIRSAYLEQVRQHPPDRDPESFERIRDAYEAMRDPRQRARQAVLGLDPMTPLTSLLGDGQPRRRFAGPRLWLDALKQARENPA